MSSYVSTDDDHIECFTKKKKLFKNIQVFVAYPNKASLFAIGGKIMQALLNITNIHEVIKCIPQ